jgi:acyl CoA:acetate/3-ketoacid CoA transferase beta subunit
VLRFHDNGEAFLASVHPGIEVEDVLGNTGWRLQNSERVSQTVPPSDAELTAIREYDKQGFWTS